MPSQFELACILTALIEDRKVHEGIPVPHRVQLVLALKGEERRHLAAERLQGAKRTNKYQHGDTNYLAIEATAAYSAIQRASLSVA